MFLKYIFHLKTSKHANVDFSSRSFILFFLKLRQGNELHQIVPFLGSVIFPQILGKKKNCLRINTFQQKNLFFVLINFLPFWWNVDRNFLKNLFTDYVCFFEVFLLIRFAWLFNCSDPSWGGRNYILKCFFLFRQFWRIKIFIVESCEWYH